MDWLLIQRLCVMAATLGVAVGILGFCIFFTNFSKVGLLIIFLGGVIFAPSTFLASYAQDQRHYEITDARSWDTIEIQNITCLNDGTAWSVKGGGHFVLGTGTVVVNGQSRDVYTYYKETPQGYLQGSLDAANVYIREDENLHPYIEWDYSHSKMGLKRFTDDGSTDYTLNEAQTDTLTATIIHVPNGTVYREFSVGGA
jgi:hypothetical protein